MQRSTADGPLSATAGSFSSTPITIGQANRAVLCFHAVRSLVSLSLVAIVLSAAVAWAQDPQGNDRGRGARRSRPPEDAAQRAARLEGLLRQLDRNGNGMIDADEAEAGPGQFLQRMLRRGGTEPQFPIPISQLQQTLADSFRTRNAGPSGDQSPGGAPPTAPGGPPKVMGFGDANKPAAPAAASGAEPKPTPPPQTPASPATAIAEAPADLRIPALVATIIQQSDKDGDGKLARGEWITPGKWGTFDEANRSGGDFVTSDELIVHLIDLLRRGQLSGELGNSAGAPEASAVEAASTSTSPPARKSGRFLTSAERLPKGLPDWFTAKDADGDGQIAMAEFARQWSPDRVAEFDRYDRNHDGVITAAECLKTAKP
jgi:hypothetical protein